LEKTAKFQRQVRPANAIISIRRSDGDVVVAPIVGPGRGH
jgi:hypothetical protein